MTTDFISELEFEFHYEPNQIEWEDIEDLPQDHIWTLVDTDGVIYASPGLHFVNRIGYVFTKMPWEDESTDAIWHLNAED